VAENVPESEFDVWLVTCHEKPEQLLAEIPLRGEDQVPSIEGTDDVGVEAVVEDAVLGASIDEFCSKPAHAPAAAAASRSPKARSRCMFGDPGARTHFGRTPCNGHYEKTTPGVKPVVDARAQR
jgi:hypothetical protein